MTPMGHIEIIVVENGYALMQGSYGGGHISLPTSKYVFETFENLIAWMKENLAKPGDGK